MSAYRFFLVWIGICLAQLAHAQQHATSDRPNDFLDQAFHRQRREQLRQRLPAHSVAVFFASPVRNRANDVDFHFHQDPDFYYLTGLREPNAVLVLYASEQTIDGQAHQEVIFVQPRDPQAELWNGRRLGAEGVREELGFSKVLLNHEFAAFQLKPEDFSQVLFKPLPGDVRDDPNDGADLYNLVQQFRWKINLPTDYNAEQHRVHELIRTEGLKNPQAVNSYLSNLTLSRAQSGYSGYLATDKAITGFRTASDRKTRQQIINSLPTLKYNGFLLDDFLNEMREVKTEEELKRLRKAIAMSAIGQVEVMKAMHPDMSESEIQGIHEFVYKKYGAEYEGYPSIVGSGPNGCILHYITNNRPRVGNDLVLMDLGAEYRGYTADVTRTIPANGTFSETQRQIYELVYKAQEAGFAQCKVGNPFHAPHQAAEKVIAAGLLKLGIISSESEARMYFPHGTSHYLGLDVHDRGTFGPFRANTVITVEPGIYIPEGSPCDKKWWGIAVRIEDDILITEKGWENLSVDAPRTVAEIEKLMAQPSPLDQFKLPELK